MDIYEYCQRSAVCGIPREELLNLLENQSRLFYLKHTANNLLLTARNSAGREMLQQGFPRVIKCIREYYETPEREDLHIATNNSFLACDQTRTGFRIYNSSIGVERNDCKACHLAALQLAREGKLENKKVKKKVKAKKEKER